MFRKASYVVISEQVQTAG